MPARAIFRIAVRRAQLTLLRMRAIVGQRELSPAQKMEANACILGIVHCDAFAGRAMEWELMQAADMQSVIDNDCDYILCCRHKMSHGARKVPRAPVRAAMACFLSLPRKDTEKTLLFPTASGPARVSRVLRW